MELMTESQQNLRAGNIVREIKITDGRLTTAGLLNTDTGTQYATAGQAAEFELTFLDGAATRTVSSHNFECVSLTAGTDQSTAVCRAKVDGVDLEVTVYYQSAGKTLQKWLTIAPVVGSNLILTRVKLEQLPLANLTGQQPVSRWNKKYDTGEDNVHSGKPDNIDELQTRFIASDACRAVLKENEKDAGLFFFTAVVLGHEQYTDGMLEMAVDVYAPLCEGLTTGKAVIAGYSGPAEIGFKRYTDFLLTNYCCVRDKKLDVSWSTWLVTLVSTGKGIFGSYNTSFLLEYLDLMKDAGFFDILHLDLGWEANYPLEVSTVKFPNGMEEVSNKAREYGFGMTYWVNPFSSIYWRSNLEEEKPEWHVPGNKSGKVDATAICIMTEHYDYVKKRFVELVLDLNASVIYWDGLDWNIPECSAENHAHANQQELKVRATDRLVGLCDAVHQTKDSAMLVNFSLPMDNHRLSAIDQEQVSDTYSFPTLEVEVIHRQQLYQMTWEHPYKAIWGSWYGLSWHDAGADNLLRPIEELKHAEMSMIGNGIAQAGGGFDFKQATQEFMDWLRLLFAFRKRFSNYFDTYQHILGFPDGQNIDGSAHTANGKGFLVLVNPSREEKTVTIPLTEIELELDATKAYTLTDWSNLTEPKPLGSFKPEVAPEISLGPLEVKYIGINI